jgi:hypothetical protein
MIHQKREYPIRSLLLLVLIAIVAYWPISFMHNCLKWDMIDVVLPFRYFAGECWNEGFLPLWNPYQQMGYPIHADMQCPAWYPETIFIGLLGGYSNYTLHYLFIFYLVVGGWGFYKLTRYAGAKQQAALLSAIAFILSGFFVGHAQAFFAMISAVWVPYILLNYLRLCEKGNFRYLLKASLFMFLLITNGYHSFTIILAYILLLIFIYYVVRFMRMRAWGKTGKLLLVIAGFFVLTMVLSSVIVVAALQLQGLVDRADGLPLESALINPLSPQSLLSLFIPFSTVKNPEFFQTDVSMANAYIGLLMFIFSFNFLIRRQNIKSWLALGVAVFCLLASFGSYTPVREFLYHHIPLMNLFRFPSYFSFFTQLIFLIFAALGLHHYLASPKNEQKRLQYIALPIALFLLLLFIYSLFKFNVRDIQFKHIASGFHQMLGASSFWEHVFLHTFIQFSIVSLFIILLRSRLRLKNRLIFLLVVFEMLIAVQLNIFYTGVSHKKPKALREQLQQLPDGFPIPQGKILNQNDGSRVFLPVWRNTGIFYKEVHYDAFSSFWLKNYTRLFEEYPNLSTSSLNNPLVYLSDQIYPMDSLADSLLRLSDHRKVFVEDYIYFNDLHHHEDDTAYITVFSPNRIEISAKIKETNLLCILQSFYPGWDVYVNGKKNEIKHLNILYMGVQLPEGESKVVFEYKNPMIKTAFIISYTFFGLVLLLLGVLYFTKRR